MDCDIWGSSQQAGGGGQRAGGPVSRCSNGHSGHGPQHAQPGQSPLDIQTGGFSRLSRVHMDFLGLIPSGI